MKNTDEIMRLKQVREALELNQGEFAETLGLKQGSYSDIERGKNGVSGSVKQLLFSVHNVNSTWFESGQGNMFTKPSSTKSGDDEWKTKYYNALEEIAELSRQLLKATKDKK